MTFLWPGLPRSFTCSQSCISSRLPPPTLSHTSLVPSQSQALCLPTLLLSQGRSCAHAATHWASTPRTERSQWCSQEQLLGQSGEAGSGVPDWALGTTPPTTRERGLSSAGKKEGEVQSQLHGQGLGQGSPQTGAIPQSSTVGLTVVPCLLVGKHLRRLGSLLISRLRV